MRAKGANGVGRFRVDLEIANNDDMPLVRPGLLAADDVRRETIRGVVESHRPLGVGPSVCLSIHFRERSSPGTPRATSVGTRYRSTRPG